MAKQDKNILIVGAGPVGLTLALELKRRGYAPRLIDQGSGPTPAKESRALAFNLRSLMLLEASGVSKQIIEHGCNIEQARFHWQGKLLGKLVVRQHPHPQARLTVIEQGASENILLRHLETKGIIPEWNTKFVPPKNGDDTLIAHLQRPDGSIEKSVFDYVIGCDGAHSAVRKFARIDFAGETSETKWSLLDAVYSTDVIPSNLRAFLAPGSARAQIPISSKKLRIISNGTISENEIPHKNHLQGITWRSTFSVSYRMVETFSKGNIYLCGDAAHIHSPVGGRGMNLGIEDACWLAWCIAEDRLDQYNPARLKAAKHVLAQTKNQTKVITGKQSGAAFLIEHLMPVLMRFKFLRNKALHSILGLDTDPPPWF